MRSLRLCILIGLGFIPFTGAVTAQRDQSGGLSREYSMTLGTGTTTTQISGTSGSTQQLTGSAGMALTQLTFSERNNRPCLLESRFASWKADDQGREVNGQTRVENRSVGNCNASNSSAETLGRNDLAITGLRICQRSQNGRIKGAELRAAGIFSGGLVSRDLLRSARFERPNCNDWRPWVECSNGSVANGLLVHREGDLIVGLALQCARATVVAAPGRRPTDATIQLSVDRPNRLSVESNSQDTGTSGLTATSELLSGNRNMVLMSITFGERNDRPCYIRASFETWRPDIRRMDATFDRCNGNFGSLKTVRFPASTVDRRVVSTVQVCQRQNNDRLKGIAIRGSTVSSNAAIADPAINDSDQRTNCNDWNGEVSCPNNQVAVGLKVHYRPSENRPVEVVGLGLRCAVARYGPGR